jgi:outer membrane lipoprotein-sorting protein
MHIRSKDFMPWCSGFSQTFFEQTRIHSSILDNSGGFLMKKAMIFCILGIFLISITTAPGYSQTAKEILQKMIEAQGGKKALESVDDATITGTIELIQQGLSGPITMYRKEPSKVRYDVELMGMVISQAYDGTLAWWTNPQTLAVEEMPPDEAASMKREALPRDSIFNPEKYGISYNNKGKEKIEEKDHFVIEQTFADDFTATLYVDCATYLITKSKGTFSSEMGEMEFEQFASDYKKVNGIVTAHKLTTNINGVEDRIITITDIQYNTGLEDSLFVMEE